MKKNSTLLILSLCLTILSCKGDKKTDSISEPKTEEKEKSDDSSISDPSNDMKSFAYVPTNQVNKPLEDGDSYEKKHVLKESENNFKITSDNIHVVIPNSDENMKILDVFNISDYNNKRNYNAIVIHLSNGLITSTSNIVSHKLIADLKISKITGFSKKYLKDGNLKVYIINEDVIDASEKSAFIECAKKETAYSHNKCTLPQEIMALDANGNPVFKPREQEGDIITGG